MNFFNFNPNLETILAITGAIFGLIAQVLLWIYLIGTVRKAAVPEYTDFRININLAYLFSLLTLGFMCLTGSAPIVAFSQNLLVLQLALWVCTSIGVIILLAAYTRQREYTKPALSASLIKLVLTALALWIFA